MYEKEEKKNTIQSRIRYATTNFGGKRNKYDGNQTEKGKWKRNNEKKRRL